MQETEFDTALLEGPGRRIEHSLKRESLLREAEASLERLGIDAIDLYQIHWPIPEPDIEEGWAALAELKDQGLVRHIGLSNFHVHELRRIQEIAPVETVQPQYSLLVREAEEEILPYCERGGIGVIVYSPPDQVGPIAGTANLGLSTDDIAEIEGRA
ncbi:MAG TPA: aldo/keto reductase [Thermoleophilaceae bacterium]